MAVHVHAQCQINRFVDHAHVLANLDDDAVQIHNRIDGILAGALGGTGAGVAVGMLVASGPVGWGVALIASALGGFFAQEAGKAVSKVVFDQYGQKLDLVSGTSLGRFCS